MTLTVVGDVYCSKLILVIAVARRERGRRGGEEKSQQVLTVGAIVADSLSL